MMPIFIGIGAGLLFLIFGLLIDLNKRLAAVETELAELAERGYR